jgi:integrase
MKLIDAEIKAIKPTGKQQKIADGNGLVLLVMTNGSKVWRYRYRYNGVEKMLSLGKYPAVTLKEARAERERVSGLLAQGIDPSTERKEAKIKQAFAIENDFKSVARAWWELWRVKYSQVHADKVWVRIDRDVNSIIGNYPIRDVTPSLIILCIKGIVERGALDVAQRAFANIVNVFKYAKTHELIENNPADGITVSHVIPPRKVKHHARVEIKDLPQLLQDMDNYSGNKIVRLAMQLMALTFTRTGELIGARWQDVNTRTRQWVIPERVDDEHGQKIYGMKKETTHIVPLSTQALAIIKELRAISGGGTHLFPAMIGNGKTINKDTILRAIYRMGYKGKMTGHGFRGVASTALRENGFDRDRVELQLAHLVGNEVERAYNTMELLAERTAMMQAWADYLDAQRGIGQVLKMKQA